MIGATFSLGRDTSSETTRGKTATIHQLTTMLSTSKTVVLFPDHNQLLTSSANDPSLTDAQATIKVSGHQLQWLAGGYDLEIGHF